MIELTHEQQQGLSRTEPVLAIDPSTSTEYVLVRRDIYERLAELYDDSPWTSEERYALAWEAGCRAGWDNMDEYDHYPEKS